jgi:hypothetical protein
MMKRAEKFRNLQLCVMHEHVLLSALYVFLKTRTAARALPSVPRADDDVAVNC